MILVDDAVVDVVVIDVVVAVVDVVVVDVVVAIVVVVIGAGGVSLKLKPKNINYDSTKNSQ